MPHKNIKLHIVVPSFSVLALVLECLSIYILACTVNKQLAVSVIYVEPLN